MKPYLTIVGGGLAGLTAAIACAERGASVHLYEAHRTLGGRARSTTGPYLANNGPHAADTDGEPYRWLVAHGLAGAYRRIPAAAFTRLRFRRDGRLRLVPPAGLLRMVAHPRLRAPVDADFASWATRRFGADATHAAAGLAGVLTYTADPGRLSAAFVWDRFQRATALRSPTVRYVAGGWSAVVDAMAERARALGVTIETGARVDVLPEPPVIVATDLAAARALLGDDGLRWPSGRAALLDLGVRAGARDAFAVADLDAGGYFSRPSLAIPDLAPPGHSLVQGEMPLRDGETPAAGVARLEELADLALPGWRDRVTWRREGAAVDRTGALDLPGRTWRDRPAIDRGGGVWLAGDCVAAPGLLSEVAINSALAAARAVLARQDAGRLATPA